MKKFTTLLLLLGLCLSLLLPGALAEEPTGPVEGVSVLKAPPLSLELSCSRAGSRELMLCLPRSSFQISFSQPILEEGSPESWFVVEPAVENLEAVRVRQGQVRVQGDFVPGETYTFTPAVSLRNREGLEFEEVRSKTVEFAPLQAHFAGPVERVALRPASLAPTLPVRVANMDAIRVRVYDVGGDDWDEGNFDFEEASPASEEVLRFSEHDQQEIAVDISRGFGRNGSSQAFVVFDEVDGPWVRRFQSQWGTRSFWVQRTDLGVDLSRDGPLLHVHVNSLSTARPVAEAIIEQNGEELGRTDRDGFATVPFNPRTHYVVRLGEDRFILSRQMLGWLNYHRTARRWESRLLWHVVDDRQIYRPGETVTLRGWIRRLDYGPKEFPRLREEEHPVSYSLNMGRQRQGLVTGEVSVDRFGSFEVQFTLPEEMPTGRASVSLQTSAGESTVAGTSTGHGIRIEEFRRPEFEVEIRGGDDLTAGESASWEARASYYAGGPVAGVQADWTFIEAPAVFEPPGLGEWQFGLWRPRWRWYEDEDERQHAVWLTRQLATASQAREAERLSRRFRRMAMALPAEFVGLRTTRTDELGRSTVDMELNPIGSGYPRWIGASVLVEGENRQVRRTTSVRLVHPASAYVGILPDRRFLRPGQALEVRAVAVSPDGQLVSGLEIEMGLRRATGRDEYAEPRQCRRQSRDNEVSCRFSDLESGYYVLNARVEDEQGRISRTSMDFYVAGTSLWSFLFWPRGAEQETGETLTLMPERAHYEVGDVARLLVGSPYYPLEGVVELRREGLLERRRVTVTERNPLIEIPLKDEMVPNVHVSFFALGSGASLAPENFAEGHLELPVSGGTHELRVQIVAPGDVVAPGREVDLEVRVVDRDGRPVADAQVLLFAVDEAVLSLTGYELVSPIDTFFPERLAAMTEARSRRWLFLRTQEFAESGYGRVRGLGSVDTGGGGGAAWGSSSAPEVMNLRENFDALAFFRGDLVTDSQGRVRLSETLPDTLTRYRLMAVAAEGERRFGTGEARLSASLPLSVRPELPVFANVGDIFDVNVFVNNRTDEEQTLILSVRPNEKIEWLGETEKAITIAAGARVKERWPVRATASGQARIEFRAANEVLQDGMVHTFPVFNPSATESFLTYGSLLDGHTARQAVQLPEQVRLDYGGLEYSVSASGLHRLGESLRFLFLRRSPHPASLATQILAVTTLEDVIAHFGEEAVFGERDARTVVEEAVNDLVRLQHEDGGFAFWPGRSLHFFVSVHGIDALFAASEAGFDVPAETLERSRAFLLELLEPGDALNLMKSDIVSAYALSVLHRVEGVSDEFLQQQLNQLGLDGLSVEALAWLLPVAEGTAWQAEILERLEIGVAAIDPNDRRPLYWTLQTPLRAKALAFLALMKAAPEHELVEELARQLMDEQVQGRWRNTQENLFALKAFRRYFNAREEDGVDFTARAYLDDRLVQEHRFRARAGAPSHVLVPMAEMQSDSTGQGFRLEIEGTGRAYYRLGLRYQRLEQNLSALDQGLEVERVYRPVDNVSDVRQVDGGWVIRAGARVEVELRVSASAARELVSLTDWLPAGLEVERDGEHRRDWRFFGRASWYANRVEVFVSRLEPPRRLEFVHRYIVRATTVGTFIAPPAQAEEMYRPERFGRSASAVVWIVE